MHSVNLRAHLWTVKSFLKLMRPGSAVVLVTSIWGPIKRSPGALAYTVSKAALVESLAAELLDRGVRVNGVAPGAMSREAEAAKLGAPAVPPEHVADVVLWLLKDGGRWVTGALIPVDGGRRLITQ